MFKAILLLVFLVPFSSHASNTKKCSEENLTKLVQNMSSMSNQLAFEIVKRDGIILKGTDSKKMKEEYVAELKNLTKDSAEKIKKSASEIKNIETAHPECVFGEKLSL